MNGRPARSRAPTTTRTSSTVIWWRLAWLPSRRVESQMVTAVMPAPGTAGPGMSADPRGGGVHRPDRPGESLPHPGGGRRHDVEVAGVGREVVAGTGHLEEHAHPVVVEDRGGAQPVAGDVGGNLGHHRLDGSGHGVARCPGAELDED